jgi:hypothetical protein
MLAASAAARCMPFDISVVTVLCSSTEAAVDVTYSLTSWIAFLMRLDLPNLHHPGRVTIDPYIPECRLSSGGQ